MRKNIILLLLFLSITILGYIVFLQNNSSRSNTKHDYYQSTEFQIDQVLHSEEYGDIHYSVYIPEDYDTTKKYPLYITCPGYEGLYFQGVGKNLELEAFASEAKKINDQMIILAPQFNDWEETSANQAIALIEYYKKHYSIDKVYASGYSGGGETMSLVLGMRADLIDAYLQISSKWDGSFEQTVKYRVPVYFVIGRNDEYYGSTPTIQAYQTLFSLYEQEGLSKEEINQLLVLDIKEKEYFTKYGIDNEHGDCGYIAYDEEIMRWLVTK